MYFIEILELNLIENFMLQIAFVAVLKQVHFTSGRFK